MGAVYLGRRPELDRPVAIKLILSHVASELSLQRFLREANALAKIQHPNVIRIYELGSSPHGPFLIQEYVDGTPLDELLRAPPDPERIAEIGVGIAAALTALHERDLVHRDLKPSNVILRADGSPVLLDFGLARAVEDERLTLTGEVLGTPGFMSPEQADGAEPSPATDVYGLGALLFSLLAGRRPFEGLGPLQFLAKVLSKEEPRWPSADRPETPPGLEAIVRLAMAKNPRARYPSAAAMQDDLERWLAGETPLAAGGQSGTGASIGLAPLILGVLLIAMLAAAGVRVAQEVGEPAPSTSSSPTTIPTALPTPTAPDPRTSGRSVALADLAPLLLDRTRWNLAKEGVQDRLIELVAEKLGPKFTYVITKRFTAGGATHRIAIFRHERTGIELCLLPGGTYVRGLKDKQAEDAWRSQYPRNPKADPRWALRPTPSAAVTVPPLLVGRFEVSTAQFLSGTLDGAGFVTGALPQLVNWNEATLWLQRVDDGLRLPSETEWEYAARAGTSTRFYWGDEWQPHGPQHVVCKMAGRPSALQPSDGTKRLPNAFGLVDVLGNVMELCADDWAPTLARHPLDGSPFRGKSPKRVRRGSGALRAFHTCRVTARSNRDRDATAKESGFRVVRSLPELRD